MNHSVIGSHPAASGADVAETHWTRLVGTLVFVAVIGMAIAGLIGALILVVAVLIADFTLGRIARRHGNTVASAEREKESE